MPLGFHAPKAVCVVVGGGGLSVVAGCEPFHPQADTVNRHRLFEQVLATMRGPGSANPQEAMDEHAAGSHMTNGGARQLDRQQAVEVMVPILIVPEDGVIMPLQLPWSHLPTWVPPLIVPENDGFVQLQLPWNHLRTCLNQ